MDSDDILKQLEILADPAYRESIEYFTPQEPSERGNRWTSIGVRAPALRAFEKPLFKKLRTDEDYRTTIAFTDEAFRRRVRELTVIGVEALLTLKKYWSKELLDHVRRWVPALADWGMTDLTGGLLGEMLLRGVITLDDILEYRDYPSVWGQRLLIVATVLPLRKGFGDFDRYLDVIASFKNRREKMIVKAVSWALREGSKSHPEKIRTFIHDYSSDLHSSVLREVENKLDKGVKTIKT